LVVLIDAGPSRPEAVRGWPKSKLIRSSIHRISGCLAIGATTSMLRAAILHQRDVGEAIG
jgi:hypothetical protein